MSRDKALEIITDFAARDRHAAFTKLDRKIVADELTARIDNPFLINQNQTGTCGPASILFNLAKTDPASYAGVAASLFDYGAASLRRWQLKPCRDLLLAPCPSGEARMPQADWLVLASIRDSENWFFDYTSEKDKTADGSMEDELVDWMKLAGFRDVRSDFEDFYVGARGKKAKQLMDSIALYNKDYQVIWMVDSGIISSKVPGGLVFKSPSPNHFVSVAGTVNLPPNEESQMAFPIFTWGRKTTIPESGGLKFGQFLDGYFGYVAAKF